MVNTTHFNETTAFRFRPSIWINDLVISSILAVVSLYLSVALLYYKVKVERRLREEFFQLSLEKRYGLLSKYTCICIGFVSLFRLLNSITLLVVEGSADFSNLLTLRVDYAETVCDVVLPLADFGFTFGTGLVYLFLWFRQSVFYVHSSLKVLNNKCVRFLSFTIIFGWIIGWILLSIVSFVQVRYRYDENRGCQFENDSDMSYGYIIVSWSILSIIMQIGLLGLFIYPILKRTLWLDQQRQNGKNDTLIKRVKKAVILATICLCTDILSVVVLIVGYDKNANSTVFIYSFNLVINQLVTIVCFDHWKKLLWPWNVHCDEIGLCGSNLEKDPSSTEMLSRQVQTKATFV